MTEMTSGAMALKMVAHALSRVSVKICFSFRGMCLQWPQSALQSMSKAAYRKSSVLAHACRNKYNSTAAQTLLQYVCMRSCV